MVTEEITNTNEIYTFQCPRGLKRAALLLSVVAVCIAIWLTVSLFEEFGDYGDWRDGFGLVLAVFVILYNIYCPFNLIVIYSQITVDTQYILMKTPVSVIKLPWDEVLGVKLMHKDKAFRIIGVHRNIIFNAENYENSERLLKLVRERLSPVINRDPPSVSEDVLLDMINLIIRNRPAVTPYRIFDKVHSVDRKLKYEKVKRIVNFTRNGI